MRLARIPPRTGEGVRAALEGLGRAAILAIDVINHSKAAQPRRDPSPDPSGHRWSLSDQSGGLVPPPPQQKRGLSTMPRATQLDNNRQIGYLLRAESRIQLGRL